MTSLAPARNVVEQRNVSLHHRIDSIELGVAAIPRSPHRLGARPILGKLQQLFGQWNAVGWRDENARLTVDDEISHSSHVRGDDWFPERHRFEGGERNPLDVAREAEDIRCGDEVRDVLPLTENTDAGSQTGGLRAHLAHEWSAACDQTLHARVVTVSDRGRVDEAVRAFLAPQGRYQDYDEVLLIEAELRSHFSRRTGRMELGYSIRYHSNCVVWVPDPLEIGPLGRGDGDDRIYAWGEEPARKTMVAWSVPIQAGTALFDRHVHCTCPTGDSVTDELSIDALRHDDVGPRARETDGAHHPPDVPACPHAYVHHWYACPLQLVEVAAPDAEGCHERIETAFPKARNQERQLSLRTTDGEPGVQEQDPQDQ